MKGYGQEVYRYCLSHLRERSRAEDVLQTTFVQAFDALSRFAGRATFRTWIIGIARHKCFDELRRLQREGIGFVPDDPPDGLADLTGQDPEEQVRRREVRRALEECLARMDPVKRDALLLRYHHEMSFTEMANLLDEEPATLQARVSRALPALRRCIENKGIRP